jgi:hypothetical protein
LLAPQFCPPGKTKAVQFNILKCISLTPSADNHVIRCQIVFKRNLPGHCWMVMPGNDAQALGGQRTDHHLTGHLKQNVNRNVD